MPRVRLPRDYAGNFSMAKTANGSCERFAFAAVPLLGVRCSPRPSTSASACFHHLTQVVMPARVGAQLQTSAPRMSRDQVYCQQEILWRVRLPRPLQDLQSADGV